jgi:hypothetical protein
LNTRLAIQHGVFLCPGDVRLTFVQNIDAMRAAPRHHAYELRFTGDESFRRALARLLDRQNINTEVLFPGLEGLGHALRDRIPDLLATGAVVRGDMSSLGRAPGHRTPASR